MQLLLFITILPYIECSHHHISLEVRERLAKGERHHQLDLHPARLSEIMTRDPGKYITDYYFISDLLLPTVMRLNSSRFLVCWRTGMLRGSRLRYGWLDVEALSTFNASKNFEAIVEGRDFPFMQSFPGLGSVRQNEPRILLLQDGRISFTYAGNVRHHPMTQHVQFARESPSDSTDAMLDFDPEAYWLRYPGRQKNWVPFEYNKQLHFIQQFNPLHVVTISHVNEHGAATMKTASRYPLVAELPWNTTKYGDHIRGGSQAILLPSGDKFLAFFHTAVENPPSYLILTYFMGALLFNATPPFNLLAMSEVPILKPQIYSGPWARDALDYVVFPTGVFMDPDSPNPNSRSKNPNSRFNTNNPNSGFIWVSAGYQDRHGLMMKMNLEGLLASLSPINQTPISSEEEEYLGSGLGYGLGYSRRKGFITREEERKERKVAEMTAPHNL